jgi:hypothetical protein
MILARLVRWQCRKDKTMENSLTADELLWKQQQREDRAQTDLEHREWLKSFALLFALIVLALAVATVLAHLGPDGLSFLRA